MDDAMWTRRSFLAASASSAASARAAGAKIRLGGPIYLKSADPRELAREHRRLGYSAAYCPDAKADDTARIRAIEAAFAAEDVVIAEVGAWKNMLAADPAERKANLSYIASRFALAEAVGARCCVTIAGSYNTKSWFGPHPKNFSREFLDATVENIRGLIDGLKPKRAKFAIEMMGWAIPEGPDDYLRLLKAVDRKEFGVHLDPCNGINSPARFYNNAAFIEECFRKLGPRIVSCHAKDLDWNVEMNVHFREVIPGRGEVDYRPYLRGLAALPHQPPLMLEHLKNADEYLEGATYIRKVAGEAGVAFA
jgi:sugar phosphate isomerase/epimerase